MDKTKENLHKQKSNKYILNKNIFEKINFKSRQIYFHLSIIIIQFILIMYLFFRCLNFSKAENELENNNNDDNTKEKLEEIDTNILLTIQNKLEDVIQTQPDEQKFINGIIRKYKPKKVVEIGVSGGGTSALILNAVKDIPNSKVYSIDINTKWYRNRSKKIG